MKQGQINNAVKLLYSEAKRSHCNRAKVAAAFYDESGNLLSIGFNEPILYLEKYKCRDDNCNNLNPCHNTVHAEQAAIELLGGLNLIGKERTLIVTLQPCKTCAKYLIELTNINKIIYCEEYRITTSLDMFKEAGIECVKYIRTN